MKLILHVIPALVLFIMSSHWLASASDYMKVDDYDRIHPEQSRKRESFNLLVAGQGIPIEPGMQETPVKISFIYPGKQISDYWRRSIISFKKRMDELKIRYQLQVFHTKTGTTDLKKQQNHLQKVLNQSPDYLVYTLNVIKHRRFVERIITRGQPKVIIQNLTTPLRRWEGKQPFLYVGFDHVNGTMMLARQILKRTNGKGNYAVLYHSEGYVSEMRGDSLIKVLRDQSNLRLVSSYYTDAQRERARQATLEILKGDPVKLIYACSTDIAFGIIDALKQTENLGRIQVNGWGGGGNELTAILNGDLDFTVMRMNDDNGVAMAEAIKLDIMDQNEKIPLVYSGEMVIVEKGIDSNHLEKLKVRAFRYSKFNSETGVE